MLFFHCHRIWTCSNPWTPGPFLLHCLPCMNLKKRQLNENTQNKSTSLSVAWISVSAYTKKEFWLFTNDTCYFSQDYNVLYFNMFIVGILYEVIILTSFVYFSSRCIFCNWNCSYPFKEDPVILTGWEEDIATIAKSIINEQGPKQ